ncbi:MAG: C39 family peptidase [Deltaproteobacteria bacterium]|nr:C39 family peptidase [Deltaproteobacteria bacterium]
MRIALLATLAAAALVGAPAPSTSPPDGPPLGAQPAKLALSRLPRLPLPHFPRGLPKVPHGGIPKFPRIDQLSERTADGHKSENAGMNCIPASLAAGLEYLTGKPYTADQVKEAVYGREYVGPTQIYRYLAFVKSQGVEMKPVLSRDSKVLVGQLHKLLEEGTPAVISIPGEVGSVPADPLHPTGLTHVVIAAGVDADGNIEVMNPWGGRWVAGDDAYWASRICYGELWPMRLQSAARPLRSSVVQKLGATTITAVAPVR